MTKLLLIDSVKIQEVQMGQEITVGRAYSNLLRLEGEEVSRVHAIIYRRGSDYILRDLDSKNGVLLNGHKVINCTVQPGDSIQIGKYHVIFEPPPAFDLAAYLRRNGMKIPPEVVPAGRDMDTGSGLPPRVGDDAEMAADDGTPRREPTCEEVSQASVNFRAGSDIADSPAPQEPELPQIAFPLDRIEQMLEEKESSPSPQFSADLIRLHRGMSRLPAPADSEEGSELQQHLLELVVSVLQADRGVIIYYDTGEILRLGAIVPKDRDVSVNRVVLRSGLREHKAILCNDVQNDSRFARTETVRKDRIGSIISYPLVRGETVLGLIYCDTQNRTDGFREDQLSLMRIAARLLMFSSMSPNRSEAEP